MIRRERPPRALIEQADTGGGRGGRDRRATGARDRIGREERNHPRARDVAATRHTRAPNTDTRCRVPERNADAKRSARPRPEVIWRHYVHLQDRDEVSLPFLFGELERGESVLRDAWRKAGRWRRRARVTGARRRRRHRSSSSRACRTMRERRIGEDGGQHHHFGNRDGSALSGNGPGGAAAALKWGS